MLGLVAYRLIAGAHPFSGAGLRDALSAQAVPPFADDVAKTLRPGIQSFVLAMLDADPSKRPRSAQAIAERCEELMRGDAGAPAMRAARGTEEVAGGSIAREAPRREAPGGDEVSARPKASPRWVAFVPIALGLVVASGAVAWSAGARPRSAEAPVTTKRAFSQAPLAKTTAEACGGCHAREVGEWQGSVMAHAAKSPLFGALESAVEEQVGKDDRCPAGAGVLRKAGADVCRDERTGLSVTGTGGEHWCVNCHSAVDNLRSRCPRGAVQSSNSSRGDAAPASRRAHAAGDGGHLVRGLP